MTAANPGIWRLMQASGRDRPASSGRDFRRVVLRYAVSGVAALILLGAAGVYLLQHVARDEAIRNARENAELAGRGVVAPALTPALLRADPAAVARVDRVVRRGILGGRIVRVKIWDATGRIVYSDEHRLIGSRYRSGADEVPRGGPGAPRDRAGAPRGGGQRSLASGESLRAPVRQAARGVPAGPRPDRQAAALRDV